MAELFDKKYVHFMWDNSLGGKEGFVADNIDTLSDSVENNDTTHSTVEQSDRLSYPFYVPFEGYCYRFFYYDPLYEYKRAFNEGKTVQIKDHIHNDWKDVKYEHVLWGVTADTGEYRIKLEEEYRPFEDVAELMLYYQQHFNAVCPPYAEPLIWVKDKSDNRYLITGYDEKCVYLENIWIEMKDLFEKYTFLDGSCIGGKNHE